MAVKKKRPFPLRGAVQIGFTALSNGYWQGFAKGRIYQGPLKQLCFPGLNCYSCPGALGSCPVGALQAVLGRRGTYFSFYVVGFLLMVGALAGRLVCGFLCPFGLAQDLLHLIPIPEKWRIRRLPKEHLLQYLRYGILAVFVVILPLTVVDIIGQGAPWFCQYICPSGTLMAGIPLVSRDGQLQQLTGGLFAWKIGLMAFLLILSVFYARPFCRLLCPLGAIYGLANPIALYRFRVEEDRCTHCGACSRACPLGLNPAEHPNSPECVRCGKCLRVCPTQALLPTVQVGKRTQGAQPVAGAACAGKCEGCRGCGR